MLALKNVYFADMFEKYGPLGFLANSVEELAELINSLTTESVNLYRQNIIRAKRLLLPCNVRKQLEQIIAN